MNSLPDSNSPVWLGLPATAENQLQSMTGLRLLSRLSVVQGVFEEDVTQAKGEGSVAAKLASVLATVERWLSLLPTEESVPVIAADRASDASSSSLQRCLAREIALGAAILHRVRQDLVQLKYVSIHFIFVRPCTHRNM